MGFAVRRRTSTLAALAALGAGVVGFSPLGSVAAHAADAPAPEVTVAWTPPEVLHEWWVGSPQGQAVTITNNGTATLSLADITVENDAPAAATPDHRRAWDPGGCASLSPRSSCTATFEDSHLVGDAPGPTTVTVTVVLRDAAGRAVTGSEAHVIPVQASDPQVFLGMSGGPSPVLAGRPLEYYQWVGPSHVVYEPATLTSLHSDLVGDMLDPANPRVRRIGEHQWATTFPAAAGVTYRDQVTTVVTDDEGNTASRTDEIIWPAAVEAAPSYDATLVVSPSATATVPETGGRTTLLLTVENSGNTPMTVTGLRTGDGRELLDAQGRPVDGVLCDNSGSFGPGDHLRCTYPSPNLTGKPGTTAQQTVTVTARVPIAGGETTETRTAATTVGFTDVKPDLSIKVIPGTTHGNTRTATLVITGTSKEPANLQDVRIDTPAAIQVTSCTGPETLGWADFRSCTGTVKFTGKQHDSAPVTITVVAKDDEGNTITRTLTTTLTRR